MADARSSFQAELGEAQMMHQKALEAHASERATWNATRRELEARLRHGQTIEQDRAHLQQALEASRTRYADLVSAHAALEAQLAETTATLQQLAVESDDFRRKVEAEFHGDIRAELEQRLNDARRLEEVGRLAGAMAPDLKGLVASIDRRSADLTSALDASDPCQASAREIVALSERAAVLLRQLLTFSEKQSKALEPLDVDAAVRRVEPVLRQMAGTDIDLRFELGEPGTISASADDVEHLVTALVFSGRDLLPVGGSLTVQTRRTDADPARPEPADGRAGGHCLLIVRASGYGVHPPQASSALELIVQRCGGDLYFDGTVDQGAFFQVRFPVTRVDGA